MNERQPCEGELREALEAVARWDDDTLRDFLPKWIRKRIDTALAGRTAGPRPINSKSEEDEVSSEREALRSGFITGYEGEKK
jgi:hypothetical protein